MNTEKIKVCIGDIFERPTGVWEVVGLKPGGKVELYERKQCLSMDKFTWQIKNWLATKV
jgi:hypothetical protein